MVLSIDWYITLQTVILIILILTLLSFIRYIFVSDIPKTTIPLSILESQINTGDLIAVSYPTKFGILIRVFKGSAWSHIGMIYRKNNEIFVIEATAYYKERGVLIVPFEKWLKRNQGNDLVWIKRIGPEITQVENVINKVKNANPNLNPISWLKTMIKCPYKSESHNQFFCSELVAYLLQELDIMKKYNTPSSYSPNDLIFSKIPLQKDHIFLAPVRFIKI